jgi:hypothetical protein
MIPHKNLPQEEINDDMDIGDEESGERNQIGEYATDSHFIQNKEQGSDKYKQELIEKLLQGGNKQESKKKPNIQQISERLYKNNKLSEAPLNDGDNNEKISDFKKASAMVFQLARLLLNWPQIENLILSMTKWQKKPEIIRLMSKI